MLRLQCLGHPEHGGLEERKPTIGKLAALRSKLAQQASAQVDRPAELITEIREIQAEVAALQRLRSRITGLPFQEMVLAVPAINAQAEKIVRMLGDCPAPAVRNLIPVTSPRQVRGAFGWDE